MGSARRFPGGRIPQGRDALDPSSRDCAISAFLELVGKFLAQDVPVSPITIPPLGLSTIDEILDRAPNFVGLLDQISLERFVDACHLLVKIYFHREDLRRREAEYDRRLKKVMDLLLDDSIFLASSNAARSTILTAFLLFLDIENEKSGVSGAPLTLLFLHIALKEETEIITPESLTREWELIKRGDDQDEDVLNREIAGLEENFAEDLKENEGSALRSMFWAMRRTWDFLNTFLRKFE